MKPHDRSGNWIIRQHLAKVWTHIQFYKYEPSKPSKTDFLRLSTENQTSWIKANDPEYEAKLYGDNYLGCSYNLDEDTLEEYLECRDDYDVSGLIAEKLLSITEERIDQIDEGADLTNDELEALRNAMAENDFNGWDTHSGFYFKVRFGALYALYVGEDMGQGGTSFELECVVKTKKLALQYVSVKPMVALEGKL